MLRLPGADGRVVAVHPYRIRAPFVRLLDVLQYQVVHRHDGLLVRIVARSSAPRDLPEKVRCAVGSALWDGGAAAPVRVELVPAIEREPGHAAKVKLVVSEVPPPA